MTKDQVAAVFERIKTWPEDRLEDAAELLLALEAMGDEPYRLSDDERAAVRRGLDDARHGRFATDEQVAELLNRGR
jgi:predicted transcriptional regulator